MAVAGTRKPWWRRLLKRLAVATVAFLAVAAFHAWQNHRDAAEQLDKYAVGDCLVLTKKGLGVEDTKAECGNDPSYTVASRIDSGATCPSDNYPTFKVTAGDDSGGKLCLIDNLSTGHCYETDIVSKITKAVECRPSFIATSTFKVLSRQENGAATCENDQVAITYPSPAPGRTYCTAAP